MGYRVRWPYLTVKVHHEALKPTVHGFHEGAVLPSNADPDNVAALLAKGALEELPGPAPEAVAESPAEEPVKAEAKPARAKAEA